MSIIVDDDHLTNSLSFATYLSTLLLQTAKTKPDLNPHGLTRSEGVKQGPLRGESVYDHRKKMLLAYQEVHGNMKITCRYCIPYDKRFPENMRGEKLGRIVSRIRSRLLHKNKREELEELGFDFSKQANPQKLGFLVLKQCLVQYKTTRRPEITEEGRWTVSQGFIVPSGDAAWPEEAWGNNLWAIVLNIRYHGSYQENREELEAMGLDFSKQQKGGENALGWDVVEQCLVQYKVLNPETTKEKGWRVRKGFYVPSGDAAWPEAAWGRNLVKIVDNIRYAGHYKKHRAAAVALGIVIVKK